jgi:hypothetical protein
MPAYHEVYASRIKDAQGQVFFYVREALPGVDEKWFINKYMRGRVRKMLDHANPKFAAMPAHELIPYFIEEECNGEYKRGEPWGGFLPQWAGIIYALYQWKYALPSAELIEKITLDDMERVYPALHQMGWDAALEKLREAM